MVDAAYRSEIRELFGVHFGRFDAKLEQRIAALDAKLEQRIAELRGEVREGLALLEGRMVARLALSETRLVRWMFAFWAASVATSIALIQLTR